VTPIRRSAIVLLACASATLRAAAQDAPVMTERQGDLVSVFGDVAVPAGVRQGGNVVCIGGHATIAGEVEGDVTVILGSLRLTGSAGRNVATVLSDVELRGATVERNLVGVLGTLDLQQSEVGGELVNVLGGLDRDSATLVGSIVNLSLGTWFPSVWTLVVWLKLLSRLMVFVLLLLLVAMVPERIQLVADEAAVRYVPALFVGLLGYVGLFLVLGVLSITLVGMPLALLAFWIVKWIGVAGIFLAVGRGLGRLLGRELSILGAVLLTFGLHVLLSVAPILLGLPGLLLAGAVSALFFLFVELPAVGLTLLTRFGTRGGPGPLAPIAVPASGPAGSAAVGFPAGPAAG
jgi:hypothetical protein